MAAKDYVFPFEDFVEGIFCDFVEANDDDEPVFLMAVACKLSSDARCYFVMPADEAFRLRNLIEGRSTTLDYHPAGQLDPRDVAVRDAMSRAAETEMRQVGIPSDLDPHLLEDAEIDLVDGKGLQMDLVYLSGTRRSVWTDAKGAMEFRSAVDGCEERGMQDRRLL